MKNLTSELVEEFRKIFHPGKQEEWLLTAFDRVRAEGREEIIAKLEAISEYALMTPDEMKSGYYQKGWFDCRREIISKFFSQTGQAASGENSLE